ncbi:MAG: hypothetical protein PWQ59_1122 [Thermoanaerobacterium sp.]|jgi:hypothetical protein|nr:hypothetical protein [Thermoanaerobacterium sp.]MDN5301453.1 hypothetical protein [Thermoanaerobacteraceae bacterium]
MSVSNWFDFTNDDIESAEILLKHHNKPQKRLLKAFW